MSSICAERRHEQTPRSLQGHVPGLSAMLASSECSATWSNHLGHSKICWKMLKDWSTVPFQEETPKIVNPPQKNDEFWRVPFQQTISFVLRQLWYNNVCQRVEFNAFQSYDFSIHRSKWIANLRCMSGSTSSFFLAQCWQDVFLARVTGSFLGFLSSFTWATCWVIQYITINIITWRQGTQRTPLLV